jgi:hypothetical protein
LCIGPGALAQLKLTNVGKERFGPMTQEVSLNLNECGKENHQNRKQKVEPKSKTRREVA